ncbi:MAG: protein-glutamate O-methyltransferase CheR [Alphaproteobacteria bacterium]|nr:protein-glutamate O-methyltransferase CheR [Alphaproteobacteria bacterium]
MPVQSKDAEKIEIDLLLAGIRERYGYDFTHYSRASLKRRVDRVRDHAKLPSYMALLDKLYHDELYFDEFLKNMSITVTEMFRDPLFYRALREQIVPMLKTFPFVKIWHAGCATGEEVYSMAILLHEEGFLDRTQIYATDFNKHALDKAQAGIYAAKHREDASANYRAAGGTGDFSAYVSDSYDLMKFRDYLKERVTFSYHNLVTDGVFGEMNLICCRNVLIYFDKVLQDHVLTQFVHSLRYGGFLCLGNKESLNFTAVKNLFEPMDKQQRIFKKCGEFDAVSPL